MCGEHAGSRQASKSVDGSSPRVWGALLQVFLAGRFWRLIPTCVGSTALASESGAGRSAHPHVCGEHAVTVPTIAGNTGSSPRVWGAHDLHAAGNQSARLIPTCVGSTADLLKISSRCSAHPHVCGEHPPHAPPKGFICGSSPRVWGARARCLLGRSEIRLIPTCVGSTSNRVSHVHALAAHPHVCGEHP